MNTTAMPSTPDLSVRTGSFTIVLALLLGSCFSGLSSGQEDAPAAASVPGPAAQAFHDAFDQWKTLIGELRDLKARYQLADETETDAIREEWSQKLASGHEMVADLREKAWAAFDEAPNSDRELSQFLITVLADEVRVDNHEVAWQLAQRLLNAGCDERGLKNLAGIAAFATNHYDEAGEYLEAAEEDGSITQQGTSFLSEVENEKPLWEKEQGIREQEAEADDLPRVKLQTTAGDIVLEMYENEAPETVGNFISLVEKGFYDGLTFHRVIPGFMAQGGCPLGTGTGSPGYSIYCECVRPNHRNHFRGVISMAKSQPRNTGGSQFFINYVPTPHLDGDHTVFGRVIEGLENVSRFGRVDPDSPSPGVEPTKIIKAEVVRKRDHEYVPHKVQ